MPEPADNRRSMCWSRNIGGFNMSLLIINKNEARPVASRSNLSPNNLFTEALSEMGTVTCASIDEALLSLRWRSLDVEIAGVLWSNVEDLGF